MAQLSQITEPFRLPVEITVQPWFKDHCFAGKIILPAVETLLVLAKEVKKFRPECNLRTMVDASFAKIFEINPSEKTLTTIVEIDPHDNGSITAKLLTKIKKKSISRVVEHGRVTFACHSPELLSQPLPCSQLKEPEVCVSAEKIYQELVPFGKTYQNIIDAVSLSTEGTRAKLLAPDLPLGDVDGLLGSPFPLDAAFHAACVWGQHFVGFIPFPVGFSSRTISTATKPDQAYETRVVPAKIDSDEIIFDLWIYDLQGKIVETVAGIRMRDISGGRMKPPAWIMADSLRKTLQ